ncbi:hypothetical protein [Glycomyces salinus]|uniref:hypothetical protein n=1 Tax=Glycomyces salinus TaxID=980294 RepID=UPI0018EDDD01|nr:hypothetical protein [Glycomyces salinus]
MFTTRRGLLIGAAALSAAGCTRPPATITTADTDLTAALRAARDLSEAAETLGYSDIAEDHRTHAATLERLLKPNVVEGGAGLDIGDDAALAEAESEAGDEAHQACLTTEGDYAVVLGEIAASRAAHAAVLA